MNADSEIRFACCEEFAELCALSTTGSLTREERSRLESHLSLCEKCRALLADYTSLTSQGMAKMRAETALDDEIDGKDYAWDQAEAKSQILATLRAGKSAKTPKTVGDIPHEAPRRLPLLFGVFSGNGTAGLLRAAAMILVSLLVGYQLGIRNGSSRVPNSTKSEAVPSVGSVSQELADLKAQRETLSRQLTADSKTMLDLAARSNRDQKEIADLKALKATADAAAEQLAVTNQQQSESLGSLSAQRDALQHKVDDAAQSLQNVRDDLNRLQDERQKTLLQTASLETRINDLSAELRESKETVHQHEQFLASDRDIRELMGARQLYIADVFDVDPSGHKRMPFGRIFYTKTKSLVFYAFDLDQQPGYREARAYQVWGSPNEDKSKPVSLGVFYMDSEANRRWVFKSDDPALLAQINAVFVTVEPKGESKKPTSKPFLYAYLRSAPTNHP